MKEADLERLHRPRVPTPSALDGRRHRRAAPYIPSPCCLPASGRFPGKLGPTAVPTPAGIGRRGRPAEGGRGSPFYPLRNIPGLGGTKNSACRLEAGRASRRQAPGCKLPRLFPGRGRKLQSPSPAADTRGPPARGEHMCRPESEGQESAPALTHSSFSWPSPKFGLRGQSAG